MANARPSPASSAAWPAKTARQHEDGHLGEDVGSAPPVLSAVEIVIQRAVDPRNPDQAETTIRKFRVASQVMSSARVWASWAMSTTKTRS